MGNQTVKGTELAGHGEDRIAKIEDSHPSLRGEAVSRVIKGDHPKSPLDQGPDESLHLGGAPVPPVDQKDRGSLAELPGRQMVGTAEPDPSLPPGHARGSPSMGSLGP